MAGPKESLAAKTCLVYDLGLIEYMEALKLQRKLAQERISGVGGDAFLILQHHPVYTVGKSGGIHNILAPKEILQQEGITVYYVDRGGDITYHGPGQLVGYPIINLKENGLNVHQYVWNLEEMIIRALGEVGISGERDATSPSYRGVWVNGEKVCAIGLRVTQGVTMHGFALNVNTNLRHFSFINPCGIIGKQVTSVSKLLGREVAMDDMKERVLRRFSEVFGVKLEWGGLPDNV